MSNPEWIPRSKKEYLAWAAIGLCLELSPLKADVAFYSACVLYVLRVFLWPNVRDQRRREIEETKAQQEPEENPGGNQK
jgi:hypothetical protein